MPDTFLMCAASHDCIIWISMLFSPMLQPAFNLAAEESQWSSLAPAVQRRLEQQGVNAAHFEGWRTQVARETEQREQDGEPSERMKELRAIATGRDLRAEYVRAMR